MDLLTKISFFAAVILPVWNTPLIMRIIRRRSSMDISIWWALGVWTCLLLMLPKGLLSNDIVFKAFTISNFILFTITAFIVLIFHRKRG